MSTAPFIRSLVLCAVFSGVFFCTGTTAYAASLTLSSASTNVSVGDTVRVRVLVNAGGVAINTAEATLQFPTNILSVVSVDKSSSLFSLWPDEPSYSNQSGTVLFSGGLPSPGYSGSGGTVVVVTLRAKASGKATLSLSGASVRANDGLGTNVLSGTGGMTIQVADANVVAPTPAPTPKTDTKTKAANEPDTTAPTITAPKFVYSLENGVLTISAKAKDADSGIAGYVVQVDAEPPVQLDALAFSVGSYELPYRVTGPHKVTLQVIDKAGNKAQVSGSFTVPTVSSPTLTSVPTELTAGDQLIVRGTAPKENTQVRISITRNDGDVSMFTVTPDPSGAFDFIGPIVEQGMYSVWAEGIASTGIVSLPTEKHIVHVSDKVVFRIGKVGFSTNTLLLLMLLLTIVSSLLASFAWYRLYTYRKRPHLNPKAGKDIHRALAIFKDEMETHLDALESATTKRQLTAEETSMRAEMKANLIVLEKYLEKELT
jgi:hypothetical protein